MVDNSQIQWAQKLAQDAVYALMDEGVITEPFIEAKPQWMLPEQLVIGLTRSKANNDECLWFICGDIPLLYVHQSAARNPRDAARYFAYQLHAQNDAGELAVDKKQTSEITQKAEALYQLTEMDQFWPRSAQPF